jgi:hypothetical protein
MGENNQPENNQPENNQPENNQQSQLLAKYPSVPTATAAGILHDVRVKFGGWPLRDLVPLRLDRNADAGLTKLAG